MTEQSLRVALSGFGKMGLLHAAIANALHGSELVAVADPSTTVAKGLGQYTGVEVFNDLEPMLDKIQPDAVVITCPTFLHVEQAKACIDRDIPFLVEKPLAARSADCKSIMDALAGKKIVNAVGYMARHIESFVKGKQILSDQPLGKLITCKATMYVSQLFKKGKGWRYDPAISGGGVLITQNSHLLDLLTWLFGPVVGVNGHTRTWYAETVEDFAHAYLAFDSGLTGFIDTSWSARHHRTVEMIIEVQGEAGTLHLTDDEVRLFLDDDHGNYKAGWTEWRRPDLYSGVEFDVGSPEYTRQDSAFFESVRMGTPVSCDVQSAYRVQRVIDAIYQSAASNGSHIVVQD